MSPTSEMLSSLARQPTDSALGLRLARAVVAAERCCRAEDDVASEQRFGFALPVAMPYQSNTGKRIPTMLSSSTAAGRGTTKSANAKTSDEKASISITLENKDLSTHEISMVLRPRRRTLTSLQEGSAMARKY
mmetsp:Transcript_39639/g.86384  ORF Transcript_39639/g.86384 Transcript_39639/m.86384 type:complete len:133 (-) Transcript_39639:128-526(-)